MEDIENNTLLEYNKLVAGLHEFRLINTNSILISHIFNSKNQQTQSNKDYKQLLLIAERWNELVYAINIARYYLREAIKESYDIKLCNSQYSTRMMHLYSANIWYNSIIDYILQFYYLISNAPDINDGNYAQILKDGKKRSNFIRKQSIPSKDLKEYEQMCNKLNTIEEGNNVKHRRLNLMPRNYRNKNGIGVLPPMSVDEKGRIHFDNKEIIPLSSDRIQKNTETIESLLSKLINTDKIVSAYIKKMQKEYIEQNMK